jgi:hypothetical protein
MRVKKVPSTCLVKEQTSAFTLMEVVVSVAIAALIFGGTITAYIQVTKRAEWSGYSMAAQAYAIQQLEQARSAVWDASNTASTRNELTNLNLVGWTYNTSTRVGKGYSWGNLDLPISSTNYVRVTNFVTVTQITNITGVPSITIQMVQVDAVWPFGAFGTKRLYTNTVVNYFAPDNPAADNL